MLRKLSALLFASALLSVTVAAQDPAPEPDAPREVERAFSFAFGGGSYLGVQIREVTKENYTEFGLREVRGVSIEKVFENSPAEQAGLLAGDVIVKFDGQTVTSSRKLTRLISEVAPDHTVEVSVIRGGSEISIPVTVGKREMPGFSSGTFVFPAPPKPPRAPGAPDAPDAPLFEMPEMPDFQVLSPEGLGKNYVWAFGRGRMIGVGVEDLTEQLGDYFGAPNGKGLLITSVDEESPAAKAGLKAGDVIIEANGEAVERSSDLVKAINSKEEGDVTVTVLRDKSTRTFTVTPEKRQSPEMLIERLKKVESTLKSTSPNGVIRIAPRTGAVARPLVVRPGSRVLE